MANLLKTAALALAAPGLLATAIPASADSYDYGRAGWSENDGYGWRGHDGRGHDRGRYEGRGYDYRGYEGRGYDRGYTRGYDYNDGGYRDARNWRGNDGRYYCRRSDGTTGLLIGGVAGAAIGNAAAGRRGDRTLGTLLGAAIGGIIGNQIDKSSSSCR